MTDTKSNDQFMWQKGAWGQAYDGSGSRFHWQQGKDWKEQQDKTWEKLTGDSDPNLRSRAWRLKPNEGSAGGFFKRLLSIPLTSVACFLVGVGYFGLAQSIALLSGMELAAFHQAANDLIAPLLPMPKSDSSDFTEIGAGIWIYASVGMLAAMMGVLLARRSLLWSFLLFTVPAIVGVGLVQYTLYGSREASAGVESGDLIFLLLPLPYLVRQIWARRNGLRVRQRPA